MTQSTRRPQSQAARQAAQAKADRRAAAIARQQDDYRLDSGFQAIYSEA